jgi:hypothetical protein
MLFDRFWKNHARHIICLNQKGSYLITPHKKTSNIALFGLLFDLAYFVILTALLKNPLSFLSALIQHIVYGTVTGMAFIKLIKVQFGESELKTTRRVKMD